MTVEPGISLEDRVREVLIPLPAAVKAADTFPVMSIGEALTELVTRKTFPNSAVMSCINARGTIPGMATCWSVWFWKI